MNFENLKKECEKEILPSLKKLSSKDRNFWRNKILYAKNRADLDHQIEKLNEVVMVGDVPALVEVKETKKEIKEGIKFRYSTSHLPNFRCIREISALQGKIYDPILKGIYYHILSRVVITYVKNITCGGLRVDPRIHLYIPIPSGQGKKNLKTTIKTILSEVGFKGYCPTSIHPEQLIGKVINRGTSKNPLFIRNEGYFSKDFILVDEMHTLLTSKDINIQDCRKNFRIAKDVYGENLIEKKSVDHTFDENEIISYLPHIVGCGFTQDRAIPSHIVEEGDLRRDLVLYVKGISSRDKTQSYINRLKHQYDPKKELEEFVSFIRRIQENLVGAKFTFTEKAINKFNELHRTTVDYGFSHSDKGNNFTKMVDYSLQDLFIKICCLLGIAHGRTEITEEVVELAFTDLIEFFNLQLDYVRTKVMGKLDYGDSWGGAQEKDQECLEWLNNQGAFSFESSEVSIDEFENEIMKIMNVRKRQAQEYKNKFKKNGWIDSKQIKHGSKVWLAFKPIYKGSKMVNVRDVRDVRSAYNKVFSKKINLNGLQPSQPSQPLIQREPKITEELKNGKNY